MALTQIKASNITDGTVVAAEIASNAVTTVKINADAVDGTKIADNAIDSEHYTDGSIDEAHLAADAVNFATHLKAGTDGELITWDASGNPAAVAVGTATHVLTSGGAGVAPTFAAAAAGGKVQQIASILSTTYASVTAAIPMDDTIPQNDEGTELITGSFTPVSSASKLLFIYGGNFNIATGGEKADEVRCALFVDTTANAIATAAVVVDGGGSRTGTAWAFHLETNSSTSARTYKMRIGEPPSGSTTTYINGDISGRTMGGLLSSGMYIIEIAN